MFAAVGKGGLQVGFLFRTLPSRAEVGRIAADVGLTAFIFKVDFALFQRCGEEVVGSVFDGGAVGRADGEPIEAQGVAAGNPVFAGERQEFGEGFDLPEVLHVCLVFGDDQREAGDFGGEIAQFDAAKVSERDVAFALCFATALVDLVFDMAQLFVGDDEEVAAAAGGVKDADAGDALAQVE